MSNKIEIKTEALAASTHDELQILWELMVGGTTTVLVTRNSAEWFALYRWIFEAHQYAVALCSYYLCCPQMNSLKFLQARFLVSAFSALFETQYLYLNKYNGALGYAQILEVLNAKMAVQYADRVLGPDTIGTENQISA